MKKKLLIILAIILLLISCITLFACAGENVAYTVTFMVDGEVYHTVEVKTGEKITMPDEPTKEGYTFDGWVVEAGISYDEDTGVSNNMTFVAEWKEGEGAHTHAFTEQVPIENYLKSEATCADLAVYYYSCSCGEKGAKTFTYGDTLEHSFTVKNTDSKYLASEADCENSATYYYSCYCGEKGAETFTCGNPSEEHNVDESGFCTVCDTPIKSTAGLVYEISDDGTYAIVTGYTGTSTRVNISDTYENLPVKKLQMVRSIVVTRLRA